MLKIFFDLAKDILWNDWDNYITYEDKLLLDLAAIQQEKEKHFKKIEKMKAKRRERTNNLYNIEVDYLEHAKRNYFRVLEKNTCTDLILVLT